MTVSRDSAVAEAVTEAVTGAVTGAVAVAIVGAGAVGAHGMGWRGLGAALGAGARFVGPSRRLAGSYPGTVAAEVRGLPDAQDAGERRARMLMSRGALLAAMATRDARQDAGWQGACEDVGFYLGVGASGGAMDQLTAMLRASIEEHALSHARFGDAGLRACNPLFAFQLMNNFTLCHSAILHGTTGPNAAFFSRGTGTVVALAEAVHALREGSCARALAGAADTCLHPVTWAELRREGRADQGLIPGEGAAVLALAAVPAGRRMVSSTANREAAAPAAPRGRADSTSLSDDDGDAVIAIVEHCAIHSARRRGLAGAVTALLEEAAACAADVPIDAMVLAPWGEPARAVLHAVLDDALDDALDARRGSVPRTVPKTVPKIDVSLALGESLAATTALAWIVALDLIASSGLGRVAVWTAGMDGDVGLTVLGRGGAR